MEGILTSNEIYDPKTNTWTAAPPMTSARYEHTATVVDIGRVIVAGGIDRTGTAVATSDIYSQNVL